MQPPFYSSAAAKAASRDSATSASLANVPVSPELPKLPPKILVVGVAEMVVSNDVAAELVTYSLGSCLGLAIYDPVNRVGGLLHMMLPDSAIDPGKARTCPCMFVNTGVPRLFHAVYELGGQKARLVVKVAGGAQFLDDHHIFNIGERNLQALTLLVGRNGSSIHASAVGGRISRTLRLNLETGRVSIHSPGFQPSNL